MTSRSKSAAKATAAVLSFHCVICFDDFDLQEKPPVVLPCGHTYVCMCCAKRLKTCFECRTPLFVTPPRSTAAPVAVRPPPSRYSRYGSPPPSTPPPPKMDPIPLPLPKNAVLMAMMEAAERQAKLESDREQAEDDETTRIVNGVETLSGSCGTYAVVDEEGLAVLPTDPRKRMSDKENTTALADETEQEPFVIERGQKVQVVEMTDGVATLARGMGFVVASEKQLVKVGGPLETSCQLQGTLCVVENRKQALQLQLLELEAQSDILQRSIDAERMKEPSHPVITPPVDHQSHPGPLTPTKSTISSSASVSSPPEVRVTASYDGDGVEVEEARDECPLLLTPHTIDNSDLSLYVDDGDHGPLANILVPEHIGIGCTSLFFGGEPCGELEEEADGLRGLSYAGGTPRARPQTARASSIERDISPGDHRRQLSPTPTRSFETVNFRTGMSGHRGLSSARQQDGRYAVPPRQVRLMGEHRGLSKIRGPNRKFGPRDTNS